MKVDEFRKTWIRNFHKSDIEKYEHAVDAQGDPLLKIWSEAYDINDSKMETHYSVHYSGRGDLDNFWNTLLELRPTIKTPKTKKSTTRKTKTTTKKKTITKKRVAKKTATKRTRKVKKEPETLLEF